jgi:hypothetical protein
VIDDESLVKTRTNTYLSETSGIPSYSVIKVSHNHVTMTTTLDTSCLENTMVLSARRGFCMHVFSSIFYNIIMSAPEVHMFD